MVESLSFVKSHMYMLLEVRRIRRTSFIWQRNAQRTPKEEAEHRVCPTIEVHCKSGTPINQRAQERTPEGSLLEVDSGCDEWLWREDVESGF